MNSEKASVLLVTKQSLLGECLATALDNFDVTLTESAEGIAALESSFAAAVLHVDSHNELTPEKVKTVVQQLGDSRVVVFGRARSELEVVSFLEAGAFDYRVAESESVESFCRAIGDAVVGEVTFGPERTRAIFERLRRLSAEVKRIHEIDTSILTTRELEILVEIEAGHTNAEIAELLFLSLHTVKNHVHNMLTKMNCKNRREAVHLAHANGWIKVNSAVG